MAADQILPERGSQLCLACGLCCNGALHDAAALLPEEVSVALDQGMKVTQSEKGAQFQLPCHLLKDRCCTVYEHRPSPCREYRCRLLQSLYAGERTLEECLGKVGNAQSLLHDLEEVLPSGMTIPEARASASLRPTESDAGRIEKAKIKLRAFALSIYLERYFRNDYENSFLQSTSINENNGSTS